MHKKINGTYRCKEQEEQTILQTYGRVNNTYGNANIFVRFKIFSAVTILTMFFLVWSLYGPTGRSQCFGEACYILLQG